MELINLGYNTSFKSYRKEHNLEDFGVGRIISEHKDRFTVKTETKEYDSELIGNLRFTAESRKDLPAVGDWVAISEYDDSKALIHSIYPRFSIIERKAVGKLGDIQIIATNIDYGLIVQSVNRDFNINRLERYLSICNSSKIEPIIILSKIDLIDEIELQKLLKAINNRIKNIQVIAVSNETKIGLEELKLNFQKGKTYCLLGSSGVGKSTLINSIIGEQVMDTGKISESIDRGKHVTSHRELIVFDNGILIDNPGMREVGVTSLSGGLETTFDDIIQLSYNCRFKNCTHIQEKGCAVLQAIEDKEIDLEAYHNYLKIEKERDFFESSSKERRKKDKDFGKMVKNVKKIRKQNKF